MFPTVALSFLMVAGLASPQATPIPAVPPAASDPVADAKPAPDGPVVEIDTTMGTIRVGLYATKAPISTANFMSYAREGFFSGTIFHRVIPGFMIQGGGIDTKMVEKPTHPPIRNEARNGLINSRGTLAMARLDDPHSATGQFFINVKDNPALDFGIARDGWGYAVFGEVLAGMEVVDAIVNVPTTTIGKYQSAPIKPVVITKVRIISDPAPPSKAGATKASIPPASARPATGSTKSAPVNAPAAKPKASASPKA